MKTKMSNENKENVVEAKVVKGHKIFDPNWTYRGVKYEVGKSYEIDDIKCYKKGFHFCTDLKNCFLYRACSPNTKIAEVEAYGKIYYNKDDTKAYTNKIKIVREISWNEVLSMANTGNNNTGICNDGSNNTGDRNSGDYNAGDYNTGNYNAEDSNTGSHNTGYYNTSINNTGICNTGDNNTGIGNTGDYNTGNTNMGNCNTGIGNTGDYNTGIGNTGKHNTGTGNAGDYNTGKRNTGNWNTGNYNTTNYSSGWFCNKEPKMVLFNKSINMTYEEWESTYAYELLLGMPWSGVNDASPNTENAPYEAQEWYDDLSDEDKDVIKSMPNFDADIFKECTGIDVNKDK